MPTPIKTPGVYIQESSDSGGFIVPVATAIPAFIGYTQHTAHEGKSLLNRAVIVESLAGFFTVFGNKPPCTAFGITETDSDRGQLLGSKKYRIEACSAASRLFGAMKLFFANGGSTCYVVSVGDYSDQPDGAVLKAGLDVLLKEPEPTMVVIPDAAALEDTKIAADAPHYLAERFRPAYALQTQMINHCGEHTKSRIAILDIPGAYARYEGLAQECIAAFRENLLPNQSGSFSYAAAYYPWLHTAVFQRSDISIKNIDSASLPVLDQILRAELSDALEKSSELDVVISYLTECPFESVETAWRQWHELSDQEQVHEKAMACKAMQTLSPSYALLLETILQQLNTMPPSAAMAGVYTMLDANVGVWKAPANVSVGQVVVPAISIDHETQERLNAPADGRSVCAIRAFPGMGTLVWGARTLDGNSMDLCYINVRRTRMFLEQSVKQGIMAQVFSPNDASTWQSISSMISNFLTGFWKQGGLAGSVPGEAFSVAVGLGATMTAQDILDGYMRVSIKVAVSRPAEFITLAFEQKMQSA